MGGADETGSGRRGLVWDPEEGPVWGTVGEGQEDEWSRLLQDGVSGITTDSDGELLGPDYLLEPLQSQGLQIQLMDI